MEENQKRGGKEGRGGRVWQEGRLVGKGKSVGIAKKGGKEKSEGGRESVTCHFVDFFRVFGRRIITSCDLGRSASQR